VAIKFSGAPTLSQEEYPYDDAWEQLRSMVDAFGADRLVWGSDYTRMRVGERSNEVIPRAEWATTYLDSVCFVRDTDVLSGEEKEALLGGTIRRLLGLDDDWG
jgi:predicted TIM-barrel fold metal-dependent hydrolase